MDWSEFFNGLIIGSIAYIVYGFFQNKIMYLEERISKFEEIIKNQNNNLHVHRDFFEIEISKIYDKLENHNEELHKHRDFLEIEISGIYDKLENHNGEYGNDEKKSRDAIPSILSDALAVSFDNNIGHDYLENYQERYEYYHMKEDMTENQNLTIELSNSDCVIIKDLLSEALPEELAEGTADEVMLERLQALKNLRLKIEGAIAQ